MAFVKISNIIINTDQIVQIRPVTEFGKACYKIFLTSGTYTFSPKEMEPIWQAIGTRL